jgi:hypothetical protein
LAWDKNDWMAAILVLFILAVGIMITTYLLGLWSPVINDVFPFQ